MPEFTHPQGRSDANPLGSQRFAAENQICAPAHAKDIRGDGNDWVQRGENRTCRMALQYGQDAPAQVLEGWQRQAGRAPIAVPYWDAVAALNTPTVIHGERFAGDGSPLDTAAVTERRDAFLRTALDQLPARIS